MSLAANRQLKKDALDLSAQQYPEQWLVSPPHDSFVPRSLYVTRGRVTVLIMATLLVAALARYAAGMLWNDVVFILAAGSVALLGALVMLQLGPKPVPESAEPVPAPVAEEAA